MDVLEVIFVLLYILPWVFTAPTTMLETESFIISTTTQTTITFNDTEETNYDNATMNPIKNVTIKKLPDFYEMNITSNVGNRFARTLVTSKMRNTNDDAQEVRFFVILPETAYISGFVMEIDGERYEAYVIGKEEAEKIYNEAINSQRSAGQVTASARDSNRFTVSTNIEGHSDVIFYLTYEELLQRSSGQYEILINITPGQPVDELNVQVNIDETRHIKFVRVPPLGTGNEIKEGNDGPDPKAEIKIINANKCFVTFQPNIEEQKQLAADLGTKEANGLSGRFVVQYDVERDPHGGEVLIEDGYFVHFFAPEDLPPLPKLVVFILDISGSMEGSRIKQLKEAMNSMIYQLNEEDSFHIIDFSSSVRVWNLVSTEIQYVAGEDPWLTESEKLKRNNPGLPNAFRATDDNKDKAKEVLAKLDPYGGTNIQSALEIGLLLVRKHEEGEDIHHQSIIIFLTDGEPTVGETSPEKIILFITEVNQGHAPLFCLSFGDDADRNFLREISLRNAGFTRHIYEAADAYLQIEEFYREISSPVLKDVNFQYVDNAVDKVTRTEFPIFFDGSELTVAGEMGENFQPGLVISRSTHQGNVTFESRVMDTQVSGIEKIWAYLMLRQVLEARNLAQNKTKYTEHALSIALEYSFVSPITTLVVVRPNNTETMVDTEDASKGTQNTEEDDDLIITDFQSSNENDIDEFGISVNLIEDEMPSSDKDFIKNYLPWLASVENGDGTIKLPTGSFLLHKKETSEDIEDHHPCTLAPINGSKAVCLPLTQCTEMHYILISLDIYMEYFCPLNGVAGVCCPLQ